MQHEAFFTFQVPKRRNGDSEEQYLCSLNQRAMRTIQTVTGKDPVFYLVETGGLERVQVLAYACTETFRRGNGYQVTFDDFIDGPYLGVYGSEYWANLSKFLEELVVQTFPWVAELRKLVRDTATGQSESQQTGIDDSILPSKPES